jgi:hypothetical protein
VAKTGFFLYNRGGVIKPDAAHSAIGAISHPSSCHENRDSRSGSAFEPIQLVFATVTNQNQLLAVSVEECG